jgi:hypothetical protein
MEILKGISRCILCGAAKSSIALIADQKKLTA